MLKLKLQYFGQLMQRVDSLEKTLMLGGIGGRRRRGQLLESRSSSLKSGVEGTDYLKLTDENALERLVRLRDGDATASRLSHHLHDEP